jgi:hypothetical protein
VWGNSQIFRADFVPRDSQLESIDALHEPHVEAVRALEQAVERLRDQRAEYAKQDQEFKDSLVGGTKPAEVVGNRQRQLTLEALEQAVAEARAAVVASAELVLSTVADHPSVVDDLDTVRSNTKAEAQAQVSAILTAAWQTEFRLQVLSTWYKRCLQGQPALLLSAEVADREPPDRPKEFYVPGTMAAGGSYGA